jgi:hypothetical protein
MHESAWNCYVDDASVGTFRIGIVCGTREPCYECGHIPPARSVALVLDEDGDDVDIDDDNNEEDFNGTRGDSDSNESV